MSEKVNIVFCSFGIFIRGWFGNKRFFVGRVKSYVAWKRMLVISQIGKTMDILENWISHNGITSIERSN